MKKSLFVTMLVLLLALNELSAFPPMVSTYQWRNDDGNEATATWMTTEPNDSIFINTEKTIRLRMEILTGGVDFADSIGLFYKHMNDTVDTLWHLISDVDSNDFVFDSTANIIDGELTTPQLLSISTSIDTVGFVKEKSGFAYYAILDGYKAELEFSIKASPNALFDSTEIYIFHVFNKDTSGFFYLGELQDSILPSIVLKKNKLIVWADDKTKVVGTSNPPFTLSYSGFVDGDNASVLDTLPTIICAATMTSPVGWYQITLKDSSGWDNKYYFVDWEDAGLMINETSNADEVINNGISVYPNPTSGLIKVNGEIPANTIARVYDLTGKLIIEKNISVTPVIDITSLVNGAYIVKINELVYKIVKE
jgi:hypothetical protein